MTLKKKGRLSSRMTSSFNLKPKKKRELQMLVPFFSNLFFFMFCMRLCYFFG